MKKKLLILSVMGLSVALAACESTEVNKREADYWQRADIESALYMRGPKAQHQLHKDIASCVSEVKELTRLGTIRDANPPGNIEMHEGLAEGWQSPKGDGPLHAEYQDFHDFESCMTFKGWTRAAYVKPEVMKRAHTNYNTVILGKTYNVTEGVEPVTHNDSDNYNQ